MDKEKQIRSRVIYLDRKVKRLELIVLGELVILLINLIIRIALLVH